MTLTTSSYHPPRPPYPRPPFSPGARTLAARLTEADVRAPNPSGLEHVRQGVMMLQTMLGGGYNDDEYKYDDCICHECHDNDVNGGGLIKAARRRPRGVGATTVRLPSDNHCRRRRWYRGQWLEVLNTVHQWLEVRTSIMRHPREDEVDGETTMTRRRTMPCDDWRRRGRRRWKATDRRYHRRRRRRRWRRWR